MLKIDIIDQDKFIRLKTVWNNLASRSKSHHLLQRHEWCRVWWNHMAEGKKFSALSVTDRNEVLGIAPFVISPDHFLKVWPVRKIEVLGNYEMSIDSLIFPTDNPLVLESVFQHLSIIPKWDILILHSRPGGQPASEALFEICKKYGFSIADLSVGASPYITLPSGWPAFSKKLGGKFCSNIRNREKRVSEFGKVQYEVFTRSSDIDSLIDRIFSISRTGWAHWEGTGICSTPSLEGYYRNLAKVANEEGWLYFHILSVGGKDIAFEYNLIYEGIVYNLKIGFDPEYEKTAPGKILKRYVLEDAISRGASEYNMLGLADSFKMEWTQETRKNYKWFIFNRHFYAKMLFFIHARGWEPVKNILGRWERHDKKANIEAIGMSS